MPSYYGLDMEWHQFLLVMEGKAESTSHYPQPVVSGWSMRRFEKLDLDIILRGNFIADNELNSALSGSFLNSTGAHHRSSLDPRKQ